LAALDMMSGDTIPPPIRPESNERNDGTKLPQKEFRIPLLVTLIDLGGSAPAKTVREKMEPLVAPRLSEGDYESVSTGDPRWWNAVCWERSELVKEGLMRADSARGIWEISDAGKTQPASLHKRLPGQDDKMISEACATFEDVVKSYRSQVVLKSRYFIMVGDLVFKDPPSAIDRRF
jgi:hypothetical protein